MTIDIDKDYNLLVGLRIREIRESMHLSREKFSEKCDISPSFLSDVERGKKSLTTKTIGIELLNSFNDEDMEHIINILYEIKKLS